MLPVHMSLATQPNSVPKILTDLLGERVSGMGGDAAILVFVNLRCVKAG